MMPIHEKRGALVVSRKRNILSFPHFTVWVSIGEISHRFLSWQEVKGNLRFQNKIRPFPWSWALLLMGQIILN